MCIRDRLNAKHTVVLNLESTGKEISRRLIDFLSGVAYANNGQIKRVANSTFIITPYLSLIHISVKINHRGGKRPWQSSMFWISILPVSYTHLSAPDTRRSCTPAPDRAPGARPRASRRQNASRPAHRHAPVPPLSLIHI